MLLKAPSAHILIDHDMCVVVFPGTEHEKKGLEYNSSKRDVARRER